MHAYTILCYTILWYALGVDGVVALADFGELEQVEEEATLTLHLDHLVRRWWKEGGGGRRSEIRTASGSPGEKVVEGGRR